MPSAGSPHSSRSPFGMTTLTFLVVANMIGAGVFTTSGFALADVGSPWRVLLAWSVGGVIAMAGALSYGQLVRAMPESGGEYLFLSRALHPSIGFIAGWVSLVAGFTGAIAFAATALESYLFTEQTRPPWLPQDVTAVGVVALGGLCHGIHARFGAVWQNLAVILKLILLGGFLVVAFPHLFQDGTSTQGSVDGSNGNSFAVWPTTWNEVSAFAISLVWISLSYSGFNAAVYVAGEVDNAREIVPRALVIGTLVTALLYVGLNATFVLGPASSEISGQAEVAAIAAKAIGGDKLAIVVRAIICVALLTSVMSMMMAAPRVYVKMADDGLMPAFLRTGFATTPKAAILTQFVLAAIIIYLSTLRELLSYLGLMLSVSAAVSVGCLFLPSIRRKCASTWILPFAAFYIVCTLGAGVFLASREPRQFLAMVATFGLGGAVYWASSRGSTRGDPRWL